MKFVQVGSFTMRYLDMFKSSLNSAPERKYFLDKWISVNSLVILLQQNYDLDFLNKSSICERCDNISYIEAIEIYRSEKKK